MNVSYRWLRAVAPNLVLSPDEVAERLAMRGAPVERMSSPGAGLSEILVGRVESVDPHPDADRLTVCRVDAGSGGSRHVVCGAPNVREGRCYPFAPVGAVLPDGREIERVEIRGVESAGMLCSERELGLGPDHSGLLELPDGLEPGSSVPDALGLDDTLMDVEVTPNRPDLLSHLGVAREVAAGGQDGLVPPRIPDGEAFEPDLATHEREVSVGDVTVRIEDPDLCPRYLGAVIRGVTVGPSPEWLQARLRAVGARPINNVVDATNYVLQETGQPLHAFDLAHLAASTVVVRRAEAKEPIRTLDGVERRLEKEMLAICDAERPVAIAGVMGGEDSEVSESTKDILLECALFAPASVRATRKALGISTDASYRFERGVDPAGMEAALRRAVELIRATAGGAPDPVVLDVVPRPWEGLTVPLRPGRVSRVLGVEFTATEITELLTPLGFSVEEGEAGTLRVDVPGYRSYDVTREVDLIEEVARTHGFDRFPAELGPYRPGTVPDHPLFGLEERLRDLLVARGYLEAQTMAFAPPDEGEVELLNPISVEESHLRRSLVPGLRRRIEHNWSRGVRDVRLFEIGTVFRRGRAGELPEEETRVAVALTGRRRPPHFSEPDTSVDVWEMKGLLEALAEVIFAGDGAVDGGGPDDAPVVSGESFRWLGPGGEDLGWGGRLEEGRMDRPAWADPVWVAEIVLPAVPAEPPAPQARPLPAFPAVDRDLAVVVPDEIPGGRVLDLVRKTAGGLLEDAEVFDLYRGEEIPGGSRSIAIRMRFRSRERTLTDPEVDQVVTRITTRLEEEKGVTLRG